MTGRPFGCKRKKQAKELPAPAAGTWAQGAGSVFVSGKVGGNITVSVVTSAGRFERLAAAVQNPERLPVIFELNRFVGRQAALAAIDQVLARPGHGYILIKGAAGVGKSTLAAKLAAAHPGQCAFHFSRLSGTAKSPERARRNLAAQLIGAWELFDLAPGDEFPSDADEPRWLVDVIKAAAQKRDAKYPGPAAGGGSVPPLILIVDGLDEAEPATVGRNTDVPFGLPLPEELPDGVFIIGTCRLGVAHPWADSEEGRQVELHQSSRENLDDLRLYLDRLVSGPTADPALVAFLKDARVSARVFVKTLADKSDGSWVYLRYVIEDLRAATGDRTMERLRRLPAGLDRYYRQQLYTWSSGAADWASLRLPALALLAAFQGPVSAADLAAHITGHDVEVVGDWLGVQLRPFLDDQDDGAVTRYQILHQSLRDIIAKDGDASPLPPGADYLRQQIRDAYREAHAKIARAIAPASLDDLPAWQALPARQREYLPRHAALGGLMGELLRHAAFHLSCPHEEILRFRRYLREADDQAAVAALEMTQVKWAEHGSVADRAWWLHVWASRILAHDLAASAWRLSGRQESVLRALWSGTPHRMVANPSSHAYSLAAVELDGGRTVLAGGVGGNAVSTWDPATGATVGAPMTGLRQGRQRPADLPVGKA
jgi:hypothetical protein